MPMSSPPWEASLSSQAFSANPSPFSQQVLTRIYSLSLSRDGVALVVGEMEEIGQGMQAWGYTADWRLAKRPEMLSAPTPCSLSTKRDFSPRELNRVYHISLQC